MPRSKKSQLKKKHGGDSQEISRPPSAQRQFEEELERTRANIKKTKQRLAKMTPDVKRQYKERKRAKELERILLPDAPPRKRARINSPERVPCRLTSGTPATPPPPKPQPWQQQYSVLDEVGSIASATSSAVSPLMCDWSTGGLRQEEDWLFAVPSTTRAIPLPRRRTPSATITSADLSAEADVMVEDNQSAVNASSVAVATNLPQAVATDLSQAVVTDVSQDVFAKGNETASQPSTTRVSRIRIEDLEAERGSLLVSDWLEQLSDGENEDVGLDAADGVVIDYANEAPAHLPDDIDRTVQDWLTQHDNDADQVVMDLMPTDNINFDWSNNADSFLGQREEFRGQSGPTFPFPVDCKPIDIFLKFFSDDVFNVLVTETNRHVGDILRPLQQHSRFHRATETSKEEMAVFIAVLIFQGILPLTVEKDYWRQNGYLTLCHFKKLISYNRFVLLKRLLHFTDNDTPTETTDQTKLRKLGPLLKLLNRKFSELYLPSRDIAIDESLLKWHGRLSFAQKISTKAAKVGVKSYELCEASTGYLWKFFVYTGKGQPHVDDTDSQNDRHDEQVPSNATAQIVIDLARPLFNRGHTLTMDNFYNSPLLARYLKRNGTDCLGTLRVNRDFVPESIKSMSKSELRPGEIVQSYCQDIAILLWRDKNIISMLSTFHGGKIGGKEKYGTYKYKPQAVLDYNLSMGGVDKKDQLLASHPIERARNQAWYKKVFRRLLNVTILNSYIIYKTRNPTITQRQFRLCLANELVETFKPPVFVAPPPVTDVEVVRMIQSRQRERPILRGNHFIGEGTKKHLTCVWCKKSRTKYLCKQCLVSLCINICFEEYHTKS